MDSTSSSRHFEGEQKKLVTAIKTGKGVAEEPPLVLHFLMEKYGGLPSDWAEEDWAICETLLMVNSTIQKIKEREKKKNKMKANSKNKSKGR